MDNQALQTSPFKEKLVPKRKQKKKKSKSLTLRATYTTLCRQDYSIAVAFNKPLRYTGK